MIIIDLLKAVQAGEELKDSHIWANAASLTAALSTILAGGISVAKFLGYDLPITDADIVKICGSSATIIGTCITVISVATNKHAGV